STTCQAGFEALHAPLEIDDHFADRPADFGQSLAEEKDAQNQKDDDLAHTQTKHCTTPPLEDMWQLQIGGVGATIPAVRPECRVSVILAGFRTGVQGLDAGIAEFS